MAAGSSSRCHGIRHLRWHPLELAFWALPIPVFFLLSDRRQLLSQIFIYGLFALSLDLILGYAGILSLGHAAFFGVGAYTAGLLAQHGWAEPLSGLGAAAVVAGGFGYAVSVLVVGGADLTRLMVTLGIGLLTAEAANQASSITGGVDGLADMQAAKLFGRWAFSLDGTTAFAYSLVVLTLMFALARRLVHSPFGLSLRGIRENPRRMPALGVNVHRRLRTVFALSAAMAGVAGALLAQTTRFVGIDTLGFQRSAELLIILALGGTGRLYGALLGATVFILARDVLAGISPEYWEFWLGAVLVVLVLAARGGLMGGLDLVHRRMLRWLAEKGSAMATALKTERLRRSFRGFVAVDDVSLEIEAGARHALIGPNGAGKTTLLNLLTGVLRPDAGEVTLVAERITRMPPHARVKRGLSRTFQVNALFGGLTVLESVTLAVCERRDECGDWLRPLSSRRAALDEAHRLLQSLALDDDAGRLTRQLPYGKQRLLEIALALAAKPTVLLLDEPAAGVPSGESTELFDTIASLPPEMTIVLIEHDMSLVFRFAQTITVLAAGRVVTEGPPAEIAADARVRELYLGDDHHV